MAGWITLSDWHLTKSLADAHAKDMRKRYHNDKFRIAIDKRKRIGQVGRYKVQVWDTSFSESGAYHR